MTLKSSKNLLVLSLALSFGSSCGLPSGAKTSGSPMPDDSGCRTCVSQAATLFAANQLEKASTLLRQWSKKCPRNAQLHLLLSTVLIRLEGKTSAEAETEAALACAAQEDSQACHLQYALTLLSGQKYAQSTREFETVTNLNPGSYEAWSALADLYKRLRQDPEAAKAAEKAACLEPSTQAVKMAVLQNLKRAGRLSQAKKELKRLMLEAQLAPEFEQSLANEAIQLGAYDEAIEACTSVIKAYPTSRGTARCLLVAQFLKRQYEVAESSATKILQEADKSAEILAIRALCRLNLGQTQEAESDLKAAQILDPSSGFVMLADGLLKLGRGNFEEAADSLKYASESNTKGSQADKVPQSLAHLFLSRLNRKQGLLLEAAQEAHAAASDKRFLTAAWALEARSILSDGSRVDAVATANKLAQQAIASEPEEPEALLAQSFCEIRSGKFEEAKKDANRVAELAPTDGDAKLALAQIAEHYSNPEAQRQELEKGLHYATNDPELLYELGRLYLRDNKAAQAVQLLKQAVERRVRGPEICFALAEACEKSGEPAESLKYYKQSLSQGLSGDNSKQAQAAISRLESSK